MRNCESCGGVYVRVRRRFYQKFAYHAIWTCRSCGRRETQDQWFLFLFGKTSRCPRCGSFRVERLRGVDRIDPMYKNPLSYFQKYFGANVHWCPFCRLQFYDLRRKATAVRRPPPAVPEPQDTAESASDSTHRP
jgi:hypothetical protein